MNIIPKIKEKIKGYDKKVFFVDFCIAFLLVSDIFTLSFIYDKNFNNKQNNIEKKERVEIIKNTEEKVWNKDYKFVWDESSKKGSLIFASKNGKKYYLPECKSNIKEVNKIFFSSTKEAEEKSYTLSKTCK